MPLKLKNPRAASMRLANPRAVAEPRAVSERGERCYVNAVSVLVSNKLKRATKEISRLGEVLKAIKCPDYGAAQHSTTDIRPALESFRSTLEKRRKENVEKQKKELEAARKSFQSILNNAVDKLK